MAPRKPKTGRVSLDINEIIEQIDQYPEKRGIDPDLWAGMTYSQKCLFLAKKELQAADELSETDED